MNQLTAYRLFAKETEKASKLKQYEFNKYDLSNLALWGVKALGYKSEDGNEEDLLVTYSLVLEVFKTLTPRKLMNILPIDKNFDGEKYDCKDYFYTMNKCNEHGLENQIKDPLIFLWDYHNRDIGKFLVNYLSTLSEASRKNGEMGILEKFAAENGIKTYVEKEINGEKYMVEKLTFNSDNKII